jgi:hypothetical protein
MEIVKDIRDLAFVALVIALTLAPRIVSLYRSARKGEQRASHTSPTTGIRPWNRSGPGCLANRCLKTNKRKSDLWNL